MSRAGAETERPGSVTRWKIRCQNLRRQGTQILVIDFQQGCMALIARDGRFTDADWGRVWMHHFFAGKPRFHRGLGVTYTTLSTQGLSEKRSGSPPWKPAMTLGKWLLHQRKDDRTPANLLSQQRMPGSPTTYIPSSAWMHRLGWLRFSYAVIRGCKIFRLSGFQPSSILGCFSYFQSSGGSTGLHIYVSRFQGSRVTCSALL